MPPPTLTPTPSAGGNSPETPPVEPEEPQEEPDDVYFDPLIITFDEDDFGDQPVAPPVYVPEPGTVTPEQIQPSEEETTHAISGPSEGGFIATSPYDETLTNEFPTIEMERDDVKLHEAPAEEVTPETHIIEDIPSIEEPVETINQQQLGAAIIGPGLECLLLLAVILILVATIIVYRYYTTKKNKKREKKRHS